MWFSPSLAEKGYQDLNVQEKLLLAGIASFFITALISYLANGFPERGARLLGDRYILLLLFIPLFLLLRKHVAMRKLSGGCFQPLRWSQAWWLLSTFSTWVSRGVRE